MCRHQTGIIVCLFKIYKDSLSCYGYRELLELTVWDRSRQSLTSWELVVDRGDWEELIGLSDL